MAKNNAGLIILLLVIGLVGYFLLTGNPFSSSGSNSFVTPNYYDINGNLIAKSGSDTYSIVSGTSGVVNMSLNINVQNTGVANLSCTLSSLTPSQLTKPSTSLTVISGQTNSWTTAQFGVAQFESASQPVNFSATVTCTFNQPNGTITTLTKSGGISLTIQPETVSGNFQVGVSQGSGTSCTSTCASSGFSCGTQTVCGVSTNCGSCASGLTCSAGNCVASGTPQIFSSYSSGNDGYALVYSTYWTAQTFTPATTNSLNSIKLHMYKIGNPGMLTVSIKATDSSGLPTGADLSTGTFDGNTLPTTLDWRTIPMSIYTLNAGTKYAIVIRAPSSGATAANSVAWSWDGSSPTYTGGNTCTSTNSGSTWTAQSGFDNLFEEWGI